MSNIQLAINCAINICNAPNIGYSQAYRNQQTVSGVTYYDCSSFIWYALKAAGFDVEKAYKTATGAAYSGNAITTHNMDMWLKALGFTRYDPTVTAWQQGDVMLVHNDSHQHTEMVYNGAEKRCMGAHSASYPLADQVSISAYSSAGTWVYGYRYKNSVWHAKPRGAYAKESTEALDNATLIYGTLAARGWTVNAVSALLGNIDGEGGYNPWRWEGDVIQSAYGTSGYGLVQFTPGTKYIQAAEAKALADYAPNYNGATGAAAHDGNAQIIFIDEHADYYATASYPLSYAEFKASTETPEYLTKAWIYNYERPLDPSASLASRIAAANYWYEVLSGITPPTPGGKFPIWLAKKIIERRKQNVL